MVGRNLVLTLVAIASTLASRPALAQEDAQAGAPLPTLSQRLEQFRRELLGDSQPAEQREAQNRATLDKELNAARQGPGARQARPAPSTAQQPQATQPSQAVRQPVQQHPTQQRQAQQFQSAPANRTPVRTPPRLEVQSARKAKPGGLIRSTVPAEREVADENTQDIPVDEPQDLAETLPPAEPSEPGQPTAVAEDAVQRGGVPHVARANPRQLPTPVEKPEANAPPGSPSLLFTTNGPELSVEAAGPRTILIDSEAQFVVRIRNRGAAANNVVVSMNVPDYVEVSSTHATAGTVPAPAAGQSDGVLEWKINRLASNKIETLNLVLVPHKSAPLDLAVRYTYTPEASQMVVEVQEPKLAIAVSGPDEVLYGDTQVYKLTLSNPGNGDCENVVIGLLPVGRGADGIASHKVGRLRAGETKTIDIELTARQAGTIAIKAQAYADGGLRTEAAEQVLVRRANLEISVEAPQLTYAGTIGTYRVRLVNSGDAPAESIELAAMLPPDAKYIGSSAGGRADPAQGKVTWTVGSLQPGDERTFDMQCTLGTPGDNRLQFAASAEGDLSTSTASNTRVEALADLKIEVRDPQGPVGVGKDALYEVVIHNRGSAPAQGIDLAVFFSEGLEATSIEGGEHEIATGQVIFSPIVEVGAGQSVVYRVHAKADRGGHHVFRAEMACETLGTKLAAEESTYFYAVEAMGAADESAQSDRAQPNQGEPTLARQPQPTPAPRELPQGDEPPAVPE